MLCTHIYLKDISNKHSTCVSTAEQGETNRCSLHI